MPFTAVFECKLEAKDSVLSKVQVFLENSLTFKPKDQGGIPAKVLPKWSPYDGSEAGKSDE